MKSKFLNYSPTLWILLSLAIIILSIPLASNSILKSLDNRSKASSETTSTSKISFKIAFQGIKPNSSCMSALKNVRVEVVNVPSNTYQSDITAPISPVYGEINDNGDQVFLVSNLSLDSRFNSLNSFNYLRVKGGAHLSARLCLNNQNVKLDEITTCDINLKQDNNIIYNFSNYPIVPGDINQDGISNSSDYSIIKNNFNPAANVFCDQSGDINYDGVINSLDASLIKETFSKREDGVVVQPTTESSLTPTATLTPTSKPTSTVTPTDITPTTKTINTGTIYSSNSSLCKENYGICADYSESLLTGASCRVSGYTTTGKVQTGLCPGDNTVVCCSGIITNSTNSPSATPTQQQSTQISTDYFTSGLKSHIFKSGSKTMNYWLYIPARTVKTTKMPLVIFLHGSGECGTNINSLLSASTLPALIASGKKYNAIILAPQTPTDWLKEYSITYSLIDYVISNYNIDKKRVSITGHSLGGHGALFMAAMYPTSFSCVVPIAPANPPITWASLLKNNNIWSFHGTADQNTSPTADKNLIDAIVKAGGSAKITLLQGKSHNIVNIVYNDYDMINWMIQQTR